MSRTDAVSAVTGDLFEKDWSRVRGSMQGLTGERRRSQMSRAARGHRAAVFKAIRSGGCHTREELVRQFEYLTTKSSHIVDSWSVLDGKRTLTSDDIKDLADRYLESWSDGFHPKLGHTTHMLMSFPIGTKGEDVRDIASKVCERFFSDEENGRHFDWIVAVHEDREHPHAHVVLNRKSQEGEFFYLGRDHHFNYDDFRIAMVEEAEKVGVRLEATRRVHRGVIDYPPRTREVYAAKEEGREAEGRARLGRDLDGAKAQVLKLGREYARLGEGAQEQRLGEALFRAGEILARGGQLKPQGAVYQAGQTEMLAALHKTVNDVSARIDASATSARPALQKRQYEALKPMARWQPLGDRSPALLKPPSEHGHYSSRNITSDNLDGLRDMVTRAQIETALRGTGISSAVVIARIEAGADNAALEETWQREDAHAIAAHDGLDIADPKHGGRIQDRVDRLYVRLAEVLGNAGVLRTDGIIERDYDFHFDAQSIEDRCRAIRQGLRGDGLSEAQIAERADEIEEQAYDQIEREQQAWLKDHPAVLASPNAVYRTHEDGRDVVVNPHLADEIERMAERMMKVDGAPMDDIAEAVAFAFRAMYQGRAGKADMPEHLARGLGQTYARVCELRAAERAQERDSRVAAEPGQVQRPEAASVAAEAAVVSYPQIEAVIAYDQMNGADRYHAPAPDKQAFRAEVEAALEPESIAALRLGDADVLSAVTEDRMEQLIVAKAYMQSDPDMAVATGEAMRAACDELGDLKWAEDHPTDGSGERTGLTH